MSASKPDLKPLSPWKVPAAAVDTLAQEHNIPTAVYPKASKPMLVKPAEPVMAIAKVTFNIPDDLMHRIKQRALDERRTIRSLVLNALSQYGIEVRPEDMVEDARRRGRGA